MLHYIAYCFSIFFMILEVFVLLYIVKNTLPFGMAFKGFIDILVMPILTPVQKIVQYSVLKCFKTDISPYVLLIILFYLGNLCTYIIEEVS